MKRRKRWRNSPKISSYARHCHHLAYLLSSLDATFNVLTALTLHKQLSHLEDDYTQCMYRERRWELSVNKANHHSKWHWCVAHESKVHERISLFRNFLRFSLSVIIFARELRITSPFNNYWQPATTHPFMHTITSEHKVPIIITTTCHARRK